MKQAIQQSYVLLLLLSVALFLSSFSLVPNVEKANEAPPQVQREQTKLEKRKTHLRRRLTQAHSTIQKKRLQRRLKRLEKRHTDDVRPTPVLGVLGFIAGIIALLVLITSLGISAAAALSGAGAALLIGNILFWGSIGLAVVGLTLSILHLVLRQQDQDRFNKPGFAIAGVILNGLLLGFLLLATLGGSIEIASAY